MCVRFSCFYQIRRMVHKVTEPEKSRSLLGSVRPEGRKNENNGRLRLNRCPLLLFELPLFSGHIHDASPTSNTIQDVFQTVALDTVDSCLRGFSGTILAYGQTNSGKTWTVTGGEGFEERGLTPRAIGHLFREMRNSETTEPSVSYEVR